MQKMLHERPQGALPSNIEPNPREQVNSIMTRSGLTTAEPSIPPHVPPTPREEVEKEPKTLMDEEHITSPDLLKDKEKLEELAYTLINVECSAILLNKVPEKLRDPGKFLIPCVLQDLEVCNSLADYRGSINLMPLSIYEKPRIRPLKPTRITLELANRSVTYPNGIAEDVIVKVDKFNFVADFVIVDFEVDHRVPIILRRPFLRTAKALVDLYEEKVTLRIRNEELVFRAGNFSKNSPSRERHSVHRSILLILRGKKFLIKTSRVVAIPLLILIFLFLVMIHFALILIIEKRRVVEVPLPIRSFTSRL
uniref:Reverse transcriptase domain-containing protein n=1 Tax=Tanacetum cinerariifolium TaxID=118510 RepID=A0A699HIY9_TANCI|nr:hypothetical protein [Tanacetum cinerariifolium]